ncbi:hypothetical protein CHUAL_005550, partial [Chamberlinius hualienensis]
ILGFIVYYFMYSQIWDNTHYCLDSIAGDNITQIATVAYPFVIIPIIIISLIIKENELQREIAPALLACGGLLATFIGGVFIILECYNFHIGPILTGVLVILYSFTYLVEIMWFSYSKTGYIKLRLLLPS